MKKSLENPPADAQNDLRLIYMWSLSGGLGLVA